MEQTDYLDRARQYLAEEMEAAHAAIMSVHAHADSARYDTEKRTLWQLALSLMGPQVGAANALNRLTPRRDGFTFTYVHQGIPARPKLKTNVPVQPVLRSNATELPSDAQGEDRP